MKKKILFIFLLLFMAFIPRVVYATSTTDKIHFIKNESGSGDAIVIESNGHFGLIDTMSPGPTSPLAVYDPLVNNTDNGTKVYDYLNTLGCTSLDFIVLTHNHPESIGGLSELLGLVNANTIVFYKDDVYIGDDIEEYNHTVFNVAMSYLDSKSAIKCDVTSCSFNSINNSFISTITSEAAFLEYNTNVRDEVYFTFGDFKLDLYNLHTLSYYNENLNSIATLVTHNPSGKKTALLGDQETGKGDSNYSYYENVNNPIDNPVGTCDHCQTYGIENQITDVIGQVDILKASNNGRSESNSLYVLEHMGPKDYIIPGVYLDDGTGISPQLSSVASTLILKRMNNGNTYYTQQSDGAIVVEFSDSAYAIKNYSSVTGSETNNVMSPLGSYISSTFNTNYFKINSLTNTDYKTAYVVNNSLLENNWYDIDGYKYYIDIYGILAEGIVKIDSNYYYFTEEAVADSTYKVGSMRTGFIKFLNELFYFRQSENDISTGPIGSAVSGFATIDSELYYFRTHASDVSDSMIYAAVRGLATIQGEIYYFRTANNDVSTGPEGSAIKSACVRIGNKGYCFDENAHVSSITTYVEAPTNAMCIDREYTGSSQVLTVAALAGYTWNNNTGTEVGPYQVNAVLDNGYMWDDNTTTSKVITCNILKKQYIKPALQQAVFEYYDNTFITPVVYDYNATAMERVGTTSADKVGNYSITFSLKDKDHTEWVDGTDSSVILNWRIEKGYLNPPVPVAFEGTYDGEPHTFRIEPYTIGTLMYKVGNGEWTETKPTRTDVGTTTVYVKFLGDSNHNDSDSVETTITIGKAKAPKPVVTNYVNRVDGNPHTITVADTTAGTLYYKLDDTDWSLEKPYKTSDGVYTVYVKVVGNNNYCDSDIVEGRIVLLGEDSYYINDYESDEDEDLILGIAVGTTVEEFKSHIVTGNGYRVIVQNTVVNGEHVVYTGGKTQIVTADGSILIKEYTNVVIGDPSGDGMVNSADLLRIVKHLKETTLLSGAYLKAADCTHDNNINSADLLKIVKYLKGIETL